MARGAEKAALASFAAFSVVRLTVICFVLLMLELAPFVGVFVVGRPALQAVAAGGIACAVVYDKRGYDPEKSASFFANY